jgi:hypothetical protein
MLSPVDNGERAISIHTARYSNCMLRIVFPPETIEPHSKVSIVSSNREGLMNGTEGAAWYYITGEKGISSLALYIQ